MAVELTAIRVGTATGAPPLVVLHGLFGNANNWRPIALKLGQQREVFLLNLRNHGTSPHSPEMTYEVMADDVARFIADNELGAADVLGHSMGGKTAMCLALASANLVDRLVVIDTAPVHYEKLNFGLLPALMQLDLTSFTNRAGADELLRPAVPNDRLRSFLLTNLVRKGDEFGWRVNLEAIESHLGDLCGFPEVGAQFDRPTLFVGGQQSEYRVDAHTTAITGRFPAARMEMIENAGHWTHGDQPEATLVVIENFLAEGRS